MDDNTLPPVPSTVNPLTEVVGPATTPEPTTPPAPVAPLPPWKTASEPEVPSPAPTPPAAEPVIPTPTPAPTPPTTPANPLSENPDLVKPH